MKKLYEKRAGLKAQLQSMLDTVKTENRSFTEEESEAFTRLENEIKALDRTINAEERARAITDIIPVSESAEKISKAETEERAFADFICGRVSELRAGEQNMNMRNNGAVITETIANRIIDSVIELGGYPTGALND